MDLETMTAVVDADTGEIPAVVSGVDDKDILEQVPPDSGLEGHALTIEQVRQGYESLKRSELGKAFARKYGSLSIDEIVSANLGDNVVAATTPETTVKRIIANSDKLEPYVRELAYKYELGEDKALWLIILHEISHIYAQGRKHRKKGQLYVEMHNELVLAQLLDNMAYGAAKNKKIKDAQDYQKMSLIATDRLVEFYTSYLQHNGVGVTHEQVYKQLTSKGIQNLNLDRMLATYYN